MYKQTLDDKIKSLKDEIEDLKKEIALKRSKLQSYMHRRSNMNKE